MSATDQTLDLTSIIIAGLLNMTVMLVVAVMFSVLRQRNKDIYEPRSIHLPENKRVSNVPPGLFSWPLAVWNTDRAEIVSKIGLDAVMIIRFLLFGMRIFTFMTFIAVPLMIIHFYAPSIDHNKPQESNLTFANISMQNLTPGSNLFYIHVAAAYICSAFIYYRLHSIWIEYRELRSQYFESEEFVKSVNNQVLLFTGVAGKYKHEEEFKKYLDDLNMPFEPENILAGRNYRKLNDSIMKHLKITRNLEKVLVKYLQRLEKEETPRPTHYVEKKLFFFGGRKVDSIKFYSEELKRLEKIIYEERAKPDALFKADHSRFVAFNSIQKCHRNFEQIRPNIKKKLGKTVAIMPRYSLCPDFDDIIWGSIGIHPAELKSRQLSALGMISSLTLFWFLIVAFVLGLGESINTLFTNSTIPDYLQPVIVFIQSIITPALTAGLNIILFLVLVHIARAQGVITESGVLRSAMLMYFCFQVYQMVVRLILGAITGYFKLVFSGNADIDNLGELLKTIMEELISNSRSFVAYIAAGMTFYAAVLIQAGPFILNWISKKFMVSTPREISELNEPPKFDYLVNYGFLLTSFLLAIVYSLIAPAIIPFAALSFFSAYMVLKYQLLYVFETRFESGGIWWPHIFNLICFAVALFQIMTIGATFVIGNSADRAVSQIPSLLMVPLPFLTVAYWAYVKFFLRPKTELVASDIRLNLNTSAGSREDYLADKLFNPDVVKELPKVWLKDNQMGKLSSFHVPEFENVVDYTQKTKPHLTEEVTKLNAKRNSIKSKASSSRNATFQNRLNDFDEPTTIVVVSGTP